MSFSVGNDKARFGNLPQLEAFGGLACVPTSVANALLALGIDELMQDPASPGSYNSLFKTRNELADKYYYTSKYWGSLLKIDENKFETNQYLKSEKTGLKTPEWIVAGGSVPSMVIQGTLDYIADRKNKHPFATPITLSASGLVSGNIGERSYNFTGFEVGLEHESIKNGEYIETPSQNQLKDYFSPMVKKSELRGSGVLDYLMQGLERGPVVFAMYYTGEPGGHAVVATKLEIDDVNVNGFIDYGEAFIWFVDPLNPSTNYKPVGDKQLEGVGAFNQTRGKIWQGADGFLKLGYTQKSLKVDSSPKGFSLADGDSSNKTTNPEIVADITLAMHLNTSGLASDFDKKAGALSEVVPGLVDFSFLLEDPLTKYKTLRGYAYSHESSAFDNHFLWYETLDAKGTISVTDSITGLKTSLRPGDDGYASKAWSLAQQQSGGLGPITLANRTSQDKASRTPLAFNLSKMDTGIFSPIAMTSEGHIFTPFAQGNGDKAQHFVSHGPLSWGLEDQYGLGDNDRNDLLVSLLIETIV